jgi:hypothetical protein
MHPWFAILVAATSTQAHATIFQSHEELRFLLPHTEALAEITTRIDTLIPKLEREIGHFAAMETRASAELLYTATSMVLQFHAAMVDVFSNTRYFDPALSRPGIQLLVSQSERIRKRCSRLLAVVERQELRETILKLDGIAADIETRLARYRVDSKPTDSNPQAGASTQEPPSP